MNGMGPVFALVGLAVVVGVVCLGVAAVRALPRPGGDLRWRIRSAADHHARDENLVDEAVLEGSRR